MSLTQCPILKRGLLVAVLVGSLLTVINQFERVAAFEQINLWKASLSYIVPFCVSVFSALAVDTRDK